MKTKSLLIVTIGIVAVIAILLIVTMPKDNDGKQSDPLKPSPLMGEGRVRVDQSLSLPSLTHPIPVNKTIASGSSAPTQEQVSDKIDAIRNRIRFSKGFLSEFPDIYHQLATFSPKDKFNILIIITAKSHAYKNKITSQDIAGLIGEILSNSEELNSEQKDAILYLCVGDSFDDLQSEQGLISIGWLEPITQTSPFIINLLSDSDKWVRIYATRTLVKLNAKESIPTITKLLEDTAAGVRISATEALSKLGARESIPGIIKLLEDVNSEVRISATNALWELDAKESIPSIVKLLDDTDKWVRSYAVKALSMLGNKESIPLITKLLEYSDADTRWSAVEALGRLDAKETIPVITKLLEDEEKWVRFSAASALGRLDAKGSIPTLAKLLEDKEEWVRGWAAIALVELGAKDQVPEKAISDIKGIKNERNDESKRRAKSALKELGVDD